MKKIILSIAVIFLLGLVGNTAMAEENNSKKSNDKDATKAKTEITVATVADIPITETEANILPPAETYWTVGQFMAAEGLTTECQAVCQFPQGYSAWADRGNHGGVGYPDKYCYAAMDLIGNGTMPAILITAFEKYATNCQASITGLYTP